jgi:acetate---CoA ligase (ADP-forming)
VTEPAAPPAAGPGETPAGEAGPAGTSPALTAMLEARSVAVVGASSRPGSLGERMISEVVRSAAAPRVYLVNPRYQRIGGMPCHPSLADLPEPVDLVLLGVPDAALAGQLRLAAARGDRSAVVFGGAFDVPGGPRGLRAELAQIAGAAGMALCGAGCMGFVNVSYGLRAVGYVEAGVLPAGPVALVTHSGSVFSALLRTRRAIGFTVAVSSGQELVTPAAAYAEYALGLPQTRVLALVLEAMRDTGRLRRVLAAASARDIPVVLLTAGRSAGGRAMVAAHSGALAGADGAWEALARGYGVHRVYDLAEMTDTLEVFATGRRVTPPRPAPARPGRPDHDPRDHDPSTDHGSPAPPGGHPAAAASPGSAPRVAAHPDLDHAAARDHTTPGDHAAAGHHTTPGAGAPAPGEPGRADVPAVLDQPTGADRAAGPDRAAGDRRVVGVHPATTGDPAAAGVAAAPGDAAAGDHAAAEHRSLTAAAAAAGEPAGRPGAPTAGDRNTPGLQGIATVHDSGLERAHVADLADDLGVPFAVIGEATRQRLADVLDEGLEAANPLDMWSGSANAQWQLTESLAALAADPAVAAVALAVDLVPEFDGDRSYPDAALAAAARTSKPVAVLTSIPAAVDPAAAAELRAAGVPVLEGARSGLLALRHLLEHAHRAERPPPPVQPARRDRWARLLQRASRGGPGRGVLDGVTLTRLLADYGVAPARVLAADSAAAALAAAEQAGYPVVLKTAEPGIAHKSDVGGVVLGVPGPAALASAYGEMAARLGPRVLVGEMVPPGVELAVGITTDTGLGPLVVVGAGGVLVEHLADRAVALPPVDTALAARLIGGLRVAGLLAGARGHPPADLAAAARAVAAVSAIAWELGPHLAALDINPLVCGPSGAVAVDVLLEPRLPGTG